MRYILLLFTALTLSISADASKPQYTVRDFGQFKTEVDGNLYKRLIEDSYDCEHLTVKQLRIRANMCEDRSLGNYVGTCVVVWVIWPVGIHTYSRGLKLTRAAQRYREELRFRDR